MKNLTLTYHFHQHLLKTSKFKIKSFCSLYAVCIVNTVYSIYTVDSLQCYVTAAMLVELEQKNH